MDGRDKPGHDGPGWKAKRGMSWASSKLKEIREVPDRGPIQRYIGLGGGRHGDRQIVAAARGEWLQGPVHLDEFQDRRMVVRGMIDETGLGEARDREERDPRAVAEEIQDLDVAGIVIAAAFVRRYQDRCVIPDVGMRLNLRDEVLDEGLVARRIGIGGMARFRIGRRDEGDRWHVLG